MSIHSSVNFGNYVIYDREPEWMRSERYDYCELFYETKERKGLLTRLLSLFR